MNSIRLLVLAALAAALLLPGCASQEERMESLERRQDGFDRRAKGRQERWKERGEREDARSRAAIESW